MIVQDEGISTIGNSATTMATSSGNQSTYVSSSVDWYRRVAHGIKLDFHTEDRGR